MIGFMNYLLEVAPLERRTTYVGLFNTLAGVLLVAPPLAGWVMQAASFQVLFTAAVVAAALCLVMSLGLARPVRQS
jgi:hypothetical protein